MKFCVDNNFFIFFHDYLNLVGIHTFPIPPSPQSPSPSIDELALGDDDDDDDDRPPDSTDAPLSLPVPVAAQKWRNPTHSFWLSAWRLSSSSHTIKASSMASSHGLPLQRNLISPGGRLPSSEAHIASGRASYMCVSG